MDKAKLNKEIEIAIHRRLNLICNEELTAMEISEEAKGAANEIVDIISANRTDEISWNLHKDYSDGDYWYGFTEHGKIKS